MLPIIEDPVDLDREYTPSRWSPKFSNPKEVIENHVRVVTEASDVATNTIPHKLEIEYGSTPGQKLDILGTDLPDDSPILVFIHGGYWQLLSREVSRYPALALHRSRVKTVVVGYDLCPAVTLPEIVGQIENAARFIFEYAERMGSRGVYFAGHCAGATLIAMLLSNAEFLENAIGSNRLEGAFLISGVYDLRDYIHTVNNHAVKLPQERAVSMSPQFLSYPHLLMKTVRVYIIAGALESPTFQKQSRDFYELLLNTCPMQNMYLEIRDDTDHFLIVECFTQDDHYLKKLLLHDIQKHL